MNRILHFIAGLFYGLARRIDKPVRMSYDDSQFGDPNQGSIRQPDPRITFTTYQVHMRDSTPIAGSFQPGRMVYAALKLGFGVDITLFMTRRSTHKMIMILQEIERGFAKHGEGEHYG